MWDENAEEGGRLRDLPSSILQPEGNPPQEFQEESVSCPGAGDVVIIRGVSHRRLTWGHWSGGLQVFP